jgi:hypothetical protein
MAFNAWSALGTIGGSGVLSYLAAGKRKDATENAMRLSLKDDSLLLDVRLLGGLLMGGASFFVKNSDARNVLQISSVAMLSSLATTEVIRWKLAKEGTPGIAKKADFFPNMDWTKKVGYGALPGPQSTRVRQGAWAGA